MKENTLSAYLTPEKLAGSVIDEVGKPLDTLDRLLLVRGKAKNSLWAQNIWLETQRISFQSINEAADKLRAIQRNWVLYSSRLNRRAQLIQEKLPHISAKPLEFPASPPKSALGSWTLLSQNELLCSAVCSSPFPNGEVNFVEDKTNPPNRAYLKLWEAFTRIDARPKKGERCLDAGASPGGWTWVLNELGADVLSVDRSPLDSKLMRKSNIEFRKGDAFSILPEGGDSFDWICCDVACFPEKLFEWVNQWVDSGQVTNMVCTLKFQGKSHYGVIKKFAKIPGSRLMHLFHNKHELTWVLLNNDSRD